MRAPICSACTVIWLGAWSGGFMAGRLAFGRRLFDDGTALRQVVAFCIREAASVFSDEPRHELARISGIRSAHGLSDEHGKRQRYLLRRHPGVPRLRAPDGPIALFAAAGRLDYRRFRYRGIEPGPRR